MGGGGVEFSGISACVLNGWSLTDRREALFRFIRFLYLSIYDHALYLQSWSEIMAKTANNGLVLVTKAM